MKKLLILTLCLFTLSACTADTESTSSDKEIEVFLPNGSISDGEKMPDSISEESVTVESEKPVVYYYVGSSATNKFHLADCVWAERITDENKVYLSSYNEFIENGFSPCKKCNP